jgi:hypothetical protein
MPYERVAGPPRGEEKALVADASKCIAATRKLLAGEMTAVCARLSSKMASTPVREQLTGVCTALHDSVTGFCGGQTPTPEPS